MIVHVLQSVCPTTLLPDAVKTWFACKYLEQQAEMPPERMLVWLRLPALTMSRAKSAADSISRAKRLIQNPCDTELDLTHIISYYFRVHKGLEYGSRFTLATSQDTSDLDLQASNLCLY